MLHELQYNEFQRVLPFFHGYLEDPMMYAVIEGRSRGRVWVDAEIDPTAAFIWTGAECAYLAGGEEHDEFKHALHQLVLEEIIPAARSAGRDYLSLFSFPDSYAPLLEELFKDQAPLRTPLCTFSFVKERFFARHCAPRRQMAGDLALQRIGRRELADPENANLAGEIMTYWGSIDRFLEEGTGFCALQNERLVSWCYVQAYGSRSQTVDIWTAPSLRRRGLGTRVAAAVIESSLAGGYVPFWICDKANVGSRRLAERLGFLFAGDIDLVDIPFEPHSFYRDLAQHFFLPNGEHRQAAEAYERALSVRRGEAEDYYQAALAWALTGEETKAQEYLQQAIDSGWKEMERITNEPAFRALKGTKAKETGASEC